MKKLFAIILALLLIMTTLPLAFAEVVEGKFGNNFTWTYDTETKTLTINGKGDMGAFWDMYNPPWSAYEGQMKNLVIGDGVTSVGSYLFYNSDLENAVLGKDVKTIGDSAFRSSEYLVSVEFGEKVEAIGDYAFSGCGSLNEIVLNNNLKTIGKRAFVNTKLHSIVIPDSVTKISEGAFYNVPLKSVKIGNGVKTIEKDTFNYCADIQTLELGNSIETIGESAFYNCSSVENLVLPDGLKTIEKEAFRQCAKLNDVVFPDSLETIGQGAFSECNSFVNLQIGNGVKTVGNAAFNGCTSLETVEIPAGVEIIGDRVFTSCKSLKEINVASGNKNFTSVDGVFYSKDKTELLNYPIGKTNVVFEIPKGVKIIGDNAFVNSTLKRVVIPDTVTSIYGSAFAYNDNLDSVVIPDSVTFMNGAAFSNCMSLTNITIPKSLKRIYAYTFTGCYGLKTVNYTGSEAQWKNIEIEHSNGPLYDAKVNFNAKTHIHSYTSEVLSVASCTENGSTLYKCTCGDVFTVVISATGHEIGDWVVTLAPTATTEGKKTRACKNCGEEETAVIGMLPVNPQYPDEIMGDLNGDKKISAMDARRVLRYVANIVALNNIQISNADVNGDGKVTTIDARWILQVAAGIRVLESNNGNEGGNTPPTNQTPPDEDPSAPLTKADVIKLFNDETAKAAKGSYKISRNGSFVEPIDMGSATGTLNSIIQSTDKNASLDSVVADFLGIKEPVNAVVTNGKGDGVDSKYMIKAMTLKDADVKNFKVENNKYTIEIVDCVNPVDDSPISRATNDYITFADVNKTITEQAGSSVKVVETGSEFKYNKIVISATIISGKMTDLEYSYTMDATIKLKVSVMNATGTGKIELVGKYTDIKY